MVNWSFSFVLLVICRIKEFTVAEMNSDIVHKELYCMNNFECSSSCVNTYQEASSTCSCHPFCKLFKDCCYNSEDYSRRCTTQNGSQRDVLSDVLPQFLTYFRCTFDTITSQKYWMVSKCPQSWTKLNQCDDEEDVVGRLEDNLLGIPVVSSTGITYKNIYCALCHGEDLQNITAWSFQGQKCHSGSNFEQLGTNLTNKDRINLLIRKCEKVLFRPQNEHMYQSMIPCREVKGDVKDICGEYPEFPSENNNASKCSTVAAPLTVNGIKFKNIFCAECFYEARDNESLRIKDVCLSARGGRPTLEDEPPSSHLVPISITFDFSGQKGRVSIRNGDTNADTKTVTCGIGQVFDPLASSCVRLLCPKDYVISGEECLPNAMVLSNVTSWSCEEFEIQMDLKLTKHVFCACESYLKRIYACIPEELSLLLEANVAHNNISCTIHSNGSQVNLRTLSQSLKLIETLLNSSANSKYYSNLPTECSTIEYVKISGKCNLEMHNVSWECELNWHNESQWYLEGTSQQIVFSQSSEKLSLSEIEFQHTFNFEILGHVSQTLFLKKCGFHRKAKCPYILQDESLFHPLENGSDILVYAPDDNFKFSPNEYMRYNNGTIHVCNFFNASGEVEFIFLPKYHTALESILSTIGLSLSIFALFITLLTYSFFPSLRTRLGNIIIMNLCVCLIIAQMTLLFAGLATTSAPVCAVIAGVGHFFWMAVFSTSSIFGFNLNRTFSARNQTFRGEKPSSNKTSLSVFVCFGGPTIISCTLFILFMVDGHRYGISYGSLSGCWIGGSTVNLYAFGIPVAFCLLLNFYFFFHVTISLFKRKRSSQRIMKTKQRNNSKELLVYAKIFMVLGLTWGIGYVAAFTEIQFLWYIFTLLTSLQGVFIFFAFAVNPRIWTMWREKMNEVSRSSNWSMSVRSVGQSK